MHSRDTADVIEGKPSVGQGAKHGQAMIGHHDAQRQQHPTEPTGRGTPKNSVGQPQEPQEEIKQHHIPRIHPNVIQRGIRQTLHPP